MMDFRRVRLYCVGRKITKLGTNHRYMKRSLILCSLLRVVTASQAIPKAQTVPSGSAPAMSSEQSRTMVTTYCTGCHSTATKMGGLALEGMNLDAVANDAATWEK